MDRPGPHRFSRALSCVAYYRSVSIVKGQLQGGADEEMRLAELSRCIAGNDAFYNALVDTWKTLPRFISLEIVDLKRIPLEILLIAFSLRRVFAFSYEPMLLRLLQRCHDRLEQTLYLQPEEKHLLVRSVVWLFCLLDACRCTLARCDAMLHCVRPLFVASFPCLTPTFSQPAEAVSVL